MIKEQEFTNYEPGSVRKMDKTSLIIGILAGVIIGFIISGLMIIIGMSEFGASLQVESVNTTINIPFNSSEFAHAMMDNINQTQFVNSSK